MKCYDLLYSVLILNFMKSWWVVGGMQPEILTLIFDLFYPNFIDLDSRKFIQETTALTMKYQPLIYTLIFILKGALRSFNSIFDFEIAAC